MFQHSQTVGYVMNMYMYEVNIPPRVFQLFSNTQLIITEGRPQYIKLSVRAQSSFLVEPLSFNKSAWRLPLMKEMKYPSEVKCINPFSAGTTFMFMQTGWIQASRRVTRRLA